MSAGNSDCRKLMVAFACLGILLAGLGAVDHWHRAAKNNESLPESILTLSTSAARSSSARLRQPPAESHATNVTPPKSSASEPRTAAAPTPMLSPELRARAMKTYAALPMMFEANNGQTDPRVKFLARGTRLHALSDG